MGLSRRALGLFPLLVALQACATLAPPERSLPVPFETSFHGLEVSSRVSEAVLELTLSCGAGGPRGVRVRVPPVLIGRREVTRREVVAYEDEVVCDGEVCKVMKIPVYRELSSVEDVYAAMEVLPRSLSLAPGERLTVGLRLANAAEATLPFVLTVRLLVSDSRRRRQMEILCDSELLVSRDPAIRGPP